MYKRAQTKSIKIKDVVIGHSNQVIIQSMTNTKTSNINATIKQVNKLVSLGCKLVRVAIFDTNDLKGLKKILRRKGIVIENRKFKNGSTYSIYK